MTNDDYLAWVKYHAVMFGMNDADIAMVASWRNALAAFSLADLREASAELLATAPKFRNEHITRFYQIVAKRRPPGHRKATTCTCKTCRGEANTDEEACKFSFREAAKRYEDSKRTNERVPF